MMTDVNAANHATASPVTVECPLQFQSTINVTKAEARRYSRQLILPELGLRGFKNIRSSSVLVVGAGGLGTSACVHLAANGIGTLGIVDYDIIEESNLPRQITYRRSDVGRKKVDVLAEICEQQNPGEVRILTYDTPFTLETLFDPKTRRCSWNVVLDCVDNASTRYLLSDLCCALRIPLVSGAALKFEGQLATFLFSNNESSPCRRCWWPFDDEEEANSNLCSGACAEFGVFGPVPGLIGTLQAVEALKICSGTIPPSFANGKLLLYDATTDTTAFRTIKMPTKKSDSCHTCASLTSAEDTHAFLERMRNNRSSDNSAVDKPPIINIPRLSPQQVVELAQSSSNGAVFFVLTKQPDAATCPKVEPKNSPFFAIVDVRPTTEVDLCQLPCTLNLPFQQILYDDDDDGKLETQKQKLHAFLDSITTTKPDKKKPRDINLVILCRRGNDSQLAYPILTDWLKDYHQCLHASGDGSNVSRMSIVGDMIGGLDAWAAQVDKNFPMY